MSIWFQEGVKTVHLNDDVTISVEEGLFYVQLAI